MKYFKDSLWHRTTFQLLSPSEWGLKRETTSHCKCTRFKILFFSVTVTDLNCYTEAMQTILGLMLGSNWSSKSASKTGPSESVNGIRLEFEE